MNGRESREMVMSEQASPHMQPQILLPSSAWPHREARLSPTLLNNQRL